MTTLFAQVTQPTSVRTNRQGSASLNAVSSYQESYSLSDIHLSDSLSLSFHLQLTSPTLPAKDALIALAQQIPTNHPLLQADLQQSATQLAATLLGLEGVIQCDVQLTQQTQHEPTETYSITVHK